MKFCPVCGTEYADEIRFCQRDGQTLRSSDPTADLVGQVIADRYHISRKLGEGGMGAVYLAEHVKMGRQSAIKVMGSGMSHDPEAISRFNREAANASRINHPNVCAVYDFGETEDGTIYLAMEFVEGVTLSHLLKETGPLSLPRAAQLLKQCAEGLHAAHELGIVHRDLKPDNIMIVPQKGREVVKVVDFGIAKAAGGEAGQNVTKTGLVVGTPEYMSPEQLSGDKVDGRSDIYSLALVFYRMITDTLPFIADTAQETMIKRLTDEPVPLATARPDKTFPAALQPVMDKALARWPQDRYGSAAEFANDVTRVAEGVKGTAAFTSADTEAKTQVVRPSDIAAAKTAAMPATRVSSPKPERKVGPVALGLSVVVLALAGGGYALKDTLFGAGPGTNGQVPPAPTDTSKTTIPLSYNQDSAKRVADSAASKRGDTLTHTGVAAHPPGDRTTNPNTQTPDPRASPSIPANTRIAVSLPSLDDILDAPTRAAARSAAERIYNRSDVVDSLRAEAAALVGQSYNEDADYVSAKVWFTRANGVFRRQVFAKLIADADSNISRARN
ncbi:MAG: serine/threonine-protein kinase [Gemmatimonadota bacterium]